MQPIQSNHVRAALICLVARSSRSIEEVCDVPKKDGNRIATFTAGRIEVTD